MAWFHDSSHQFNLAIYTKS